MKIAKIMVCKVQDVMTAIKITKPGGPNVLSPVKVPLPTLEENQILIKVSAAGINRPDVMQRNGMYPPPKGVSEIPGLEVSGIVDAISPNVDGWNIGDKICALVAGGGYAEFCTAPASQCLPVPTSLSLIEAAALPETFFTVWDNVFTRGRLKPGEVLLVHGGSSGIGTTAIQLAVNKGSNVIVTAGTREKCLACEKLGALRAINYQTEDFVQVVKEITSHKGIDVVLDMVGGDYVGRNLNVLKKGGRLVQIAVQKGTKAEIATHLIMLKQITFTGSTLRNRAVSEKGLIADELFKHVWPLIEEGKIKPVINQTFSLEDATKGHTLMDSSEHIGKIVLTI